MYTMSRTFNNTSKYTLTRRGKKLSFFEDSKVILGLPKDVSERTWVEIFQKEENDLMIYDIREEIIETALNICYQNYMTKQNVTFTVHCALKAWLKIIDWYFYRHDPGEEVSSSPACFIPKREASWQPDEPPEPSPRDPFCRQKLDVLEDETKDIPKEGFNITSFDYPVIEEIPKECWFPGRVNIELEEEDMSSEAAGSQYYESTTTTMFTSEDNLGTESEVLQKVTDYGSDKGTKADSLQKKVSCVVHSSATMSAEASLHSSLPSPHSRRQSLMKPHAPSSQSTRSRATLPPISTSSQSRLGSESRLSIISDCRLRNLTLDTQFEVGSEKVETSSRENVKRK